MDVDGFSHELQLAAGYASDVEEIINKTRFQLDVALHHVDLLPDLLGQASLLAQRRGSQEHRSKRRTQLVRKSGQKLILYAISLLGFLAGAASLILGTNQIVYVRTRPEPALDASLSIAHR